MGSGAWWAVRAKAYGAPLTEWAPHWPAAVLLGYEADTRWSAHQQMQRQQAHHALRAAALDLAHTIGTIPLFHFPGFQVRIAFTGHAGKKRRLLLDLDNNRVHKDPVLVPALAKYLHAILTPMAPIPATGTFQPYLVEHDTTVYAPGPVEAMVKAAVFRTGALPQPHDIPYCYIAQVLDTSCMEDSLAALLQASGAPIP